MIGLALSSTDRSLRLALWAAPICTDQKWLHTRENAIDAQRYRTIKLREPLPEPPRHDAYLRHVAR